MVLYTLSSNQGPGLCQVSETFYMSEYYWVAWLLMLHQGLGPETTHSKQAMTKKSDGPLLMVERHWGIEGCYTGKPL